MARNLSGRGPMFARDVELPRFPHKVVTEAAVRLLLDQLVTCSRIDVARRHQHAVRPQRDLSVAGASRKTPAFVYETTADSKAATVRLHIEKTQFSDGTRLFDEEDRTYRFAITFCDPAPFPRSVEVPDELGRQLGDEGLKCLIP